MQLSIGGRLKPRQISFYLCLSNISMAQTMRQQPPQSLSPCAPSPKNISYHFCRLLVGCCVPPSSRSHQNPRPRRSLIFFSTLKSPPKTTRKRLPHTFLPGRVSYQTPPLPTTPSFCSLLCRPNERRLSKTGAPPISHFSMGAVSVPQTRKSAAARANPGARRAPVLDS